MHRRVGGYPIRQKTAHVMTAPRIVREGDHEMKFSVTKSALLNELSTAHGVVKRP